MIVRSVYGRFVLLAAAFFFLCISFFVSLFFGSQPFSVMEVISFLTGKAEDPLAVQIIGNIRLPRSLTGVFTGMNLAVSGVLLQGILKNPIAAPNIIGVNAGAGLAAVAIMTLFPGMMQLLTPASFAGALLASLLIYRIALLSSGKGHTVHIVLAGVAISALLNALTQGLMTIHSDTLDVTYTWLLGSLSGRSWNAVQSLWPWSLIGLTCAVLVSPKMNLFALGDEIAGSLGLRTNLYRVLIIFSASILAGSAVSVSGTIGFVGLVAPHSARLLIGQDHRFLVPLSALLGATLLVLADTCARTIFMPVELSVGIVTAFLGSPVFLLMLFGSRSQRG